MQRNESYPAVVLKISKSGEGHAMVHFLVDDGGSSKLIPAFFYGLRKSKKNYGLTQFQSGTLWVYYNPVTKTYKVIDFHTTAVRAGLSESLIRLWCAGLASELTLKIHGTISFVLVDAFFDGIAVSSDEACRLAVLRFLWRVLVSSGVAPSLECCSSCEKKFTDASETLYVHSQNGDVLCDECAGKPGSDFFPLSGESRNFLTSVITEPPGISRKKMLSPPSERELRDFLFFSIQQLAGGKLKTLEAGII